jgi:hypothetical protein
MGWRRARSIAIDDPADRPKAALLRYVRTGSAMTLTIPAEASLTKSRVRRSAAARLFSPSRARPPRWPASVHHQTPLTGDIFVTRELLVSAHRPIASFFERSPRTSR